MLHRFNWILLLLASITAVTPLAIDMYLPAFSVIAEDLGSSMQWVQISLSAYLLGFALSMLFFGPLADILGRRKLALGGLLGFALTNLLVIWVEDIQLLWVCRVLQALAGGAAAVTVPGIIRHMYQEHTAKGMSYVSMIMMVAPLLAPALGSLVMAVSHWRMIFVTLALYALAVMLLSWHYLPEVPTRERTASWLRTFFASYLEVLGCRKAQPHILTSMFASFAFFGYLTAIPLVYLSYFGVSEGLFGILFGINVAALMAANLFNARWVPRLGSERILRLGLVLGLLSAAALLGANLLDMGLVATVISIMPLMASLSLIAVSADAQILVAFPSHSGTATAVIGTLRFGSGALVGPILALAHSDSALPFAWLMFSSLVCVLLIRTFWPKHRKPVPSP
ncbi:multidrug effflux MFS transporter [Aliiglaciecola sp. CAU 1673]|uniref:multidrug effflux MFS transporter n=1 Tax=Aliiglaciecola sp. CAU 1673 TaxID=3032595 RepID=UPI0023D9B3D0|nr:multidrug effflux MFS transporter [Aliiglaciecola sp. CAU 1673]MDF2177960.1 multidrug effflux MFS transporter [Aliiglaciecola sp. CAU 1673]